MKIPRELWTISDLKSICLPVKQVDPKLIFESAFKYVDISSIDSDLLKIVDAKELHVNDAPSRARQLIKKNDIVFSTVRTNLKRVARVYDELDKQIASTGFAVIRPSNEVDPNYIFYYVISNEFTNEITLLQRGASYPAVRSSDVFSRQIPLAPLPEQKRIVAKLDTLFAHLDQLKSRLQNIPTLLKQFRQAVLTQAVTGGILDEIPRQEQYLFGELVRDSLLGIVRSASEQSNLFAYPYVKMSNITVVGELQMEDIVNIEATKAEVEKYSLKYGDLLFNTRNSFELVGKTTAVKTDMKDLLFNNNIMRLRFHNFVDPFFVSYYLNSPVGKEKLNSLKSATTNVAAIYYKGLKTLAITLPPLEEQKEIVRRVESLFAVADRIEASYKTLQEKINHLPQAILSKAFRGELVEQEVATELNGYKTQLDNLSIAAEP